MPSTKRSNSSPAAAAAKAPRARRHGTAPKTCDLPLATPTDQKASLRDQLDKCGYVTMPLFGPEETRVIRMMVVASMINAPEFALPADFDAQSLKTKTLILGGFGALGNPSSFHNLYLRKLTEWALEQALLNDAVPIRDEHDLVEKVFDRVTLRSPLVKNGQGELRQNAPTAELLHRDESPGLADDKIYGGWINLDDVKQSFRCVPGTHRDVTGCNGFVKIKSKAEREAFYRRMELVEVPPGHILLFEESIVHDVAADALPHLMCRVHFGLRVTRSAEPLFGKQELAEAMESQAPMRIKSGQMPRVWPDCYSFNPRLYNRLEEWSAAVFKPVALERFTVKTGAHTGRVLTRVPAIMPSLAALGLPLHEPYSEEEKKLRSPSNDFTFTLNGDSHTRVKLATAEDWARFRADPSTHRPLPRHCSLA